MPEIDPVAKVPITIQCPPSLGMALMAACKSSSRTIQAEILHRLGESLGIAVEYTPPGRPWPKKVAVAKKKTAKKPAKKQRLS